MLKILNLTVLIPWKKIEPGQSVFVPCLDRKAHCKALTQEAARLGYIVVCKGVIENGRYGLRLWRVK